MPAAAIVSAMRSGEARTSASEPSADSTTVVCQSRRTATASGIYLNAGTAGPMPAEVQKAMDDQAASELAVGRAKVEQFLAFADRMGEARSTIAAVLVADPDDIALTHSTTDGINLALSSLTWR